MIKNNQQKLDELRSAIKRNWPNISDDEIEKTHGEIESIAKMVARHTGLDEDTIVARISSTVQSDEKDLPLIDRPVGVVNSQEPEGQEWNAREAQNE